MGDRRGGKMNFREKNGEEFDQVKVALIPVFELHVPDEFGVGGHVVVSDHAAVPPAAELHADVSSDEVVRMRGRRVSGRKVEGRRIVGGGVTVDPSRPMGRRGLRWLGKMGERIHSLPPGGHFRGGNVREDIALSPRTFPHVH